MKKNNHIQIDDKTLDRLADLDRKGFVLPPGVEIDAFFAVTKETLDWAKAVREEAKTVGRAAIMGEEFSRGEMMPVRILRQCLQPARERYRVNPDWAPAFFRSRLLPWYVGGACFHMQGEDGTHVCFVLRNSFRRRSKWLLYSRKEIISHEICHVARSLMNQRIFEESLAYRISESRLRRGLGPVFRGTLEAVMLLGGSLLLLLGSAAHAFGAPGWLQYLSSVPLIVSCTLLGLRALKVHSDLDRAVGNLGRIYGDNAEAVAFRCTDRELHELAETIDVQKTVEGYRQSEEKMLRWAVIDRRLG